MNNKIVVRDDKTYVFVTRGRSKPFSDNEIADYFGEEPVAKENEWRIPDTRERLKMFMNDLKKGVKFTAEKYVRPETDIVREARRLVPHFRLES